MNSQNMLSANKVKLHGMTSTQWTTKDKITQYKGLINLYTRDKKIMEIDNAVSKKRQAKEMKNIQRDIDINRKKLDNAMGGDKQKLRNTLAEHRELQIAFSSSTPQKVLEMVHQVNFTKRKKRDMLRYKMKLKSDRLIDLKLKFAIYEDRLKYEGLQTMLPCEKQAHLITGRVQDAILKKEAAIYIRSSYKEMIAIMKKDAIYFDAILETLKNDGLSQGKCMINATKLGQLGIEYLDDRRQEFEFLQKIIKTDMVSRKKDLAFVQQNVEMFSSNMKNLIRRDSDINLGKITIEETKSFHMLQKEIDTMEDTLKILKDAFFTPSVDQIYPCIKEQVRQTERLTEFVKRCERDRNDLLEKEQHAMLLCSELQNTMVETTTEYTAQKGNFRANINIEFERADEYENLIKSRYALLAKVRISLRHLQYLARLLSTGSKINQATLMQSMMSRRSSDLVVPEEDEADGVKIIPELTAKFAKLAANARELPTEIPFEQVYRTFEVLMRDRSKPVEAETVTSEESLIESTVSDSQVLTREDVKKQSAEIVAAHKSADPLLEAVAEPPKKK